MRTCVLHQRLDAFLQEEGIALGTLAQASFERLQTGVISQQVIEEDLHARARQRVEPQLGVIGFAAPAVLVLGAIAHQQEEPRRWQAVDQEVQKRLGLGVDPVQVLHDQEERLDLAFPAPEVLEGVQGPLAALVRIKGRPQRILDRDFQERADGGQRGLQGWIQRQEPAGDLLTHGLDVIVALNLKVRL